MSDEIQIASWKRRPYTAIDKRSWVVEHRVIAVNEAGVGVDIRHETRSEDADEPEWRPVEVWEFRAHGVEKQSKDGWHEYPTVTNNK